MKRILAGALCLMTVSMAGAADFFSTEQSENLITLGARLGVNTSNRTIGTNVYPGGYTSESWRTGFDVGFVAGINFRDYLTIQPGLFFENRNSGYLVMGKAPDAPITGDNTRFAQAGRLHTYNITIPVMAIVNFNLTDDVRWSVEAGPYVSLVLGSKLSDQYLVSEGESDPRAIFSQKPRTTEIGIKVGTGIEILEHYYIGAHYQAGCQNAWKEAKINEMHMDFGGLAKTWVFTVGYDF